MAVPGVPSKKVAEIISDRKEMKKVTSVSKGKKTIP